ncbi:P-loop containing nucleoside triphosphate hydrolase protein [Chytridium lagenaria]|nr:P-loop containing nucleoside triphosphate hydrolase protein [Chytridium lagenaria]
MSNIEKSNPALEKPTTIIIDDGSKPTKHFDSLTTTSSITYEEPGDRGVMAAGYNLWTFLTLSYLNRMMKVSVKRPLEADDIPLLKPQDRAEALVKSLEPFNQKVAAYLEAKKKDKLENNGDSSNPPKTTSGPKIPSLMPVVFRSYGHYFIGAIFFQILSVAASLYIPYVLQALILFLQNAPSSELMVPPFLLNYGKTGTGVALSLFLFFVSIVKVVAELTQIQLIRNFQFDAVGLAKVALFEKSLKIGNKAEKEFSEGRIISMVNVDSEQFSIALMSIPDLFIMPPQIALILYFLVRLIGSAIIPADGRVKRLREMLMGMKIVKLRAEEDLRSGAVNEKRGEQISALKKSLSIMSSMITLIILPPVLMPIDPSIIFPALIYFGSLLEPLQGLPQMINTTVTGLVALKRIKNFLVADEREPTVELAPTADAEHAIIIENATFKWEDAPVEEKKAEKKKKGKKDDKECKEEEEKSDEENNGEEKDGDDMKKTKSDEPCSGKSSLFSAILGDMTRLSGSTSIMGRVALCQQQPWLLSTTLLQNIQFAAPAKPNHSTLLTSTLSATHLSKDLQTLPHGLATQIGEKGIILSGGQRARVALARAVYDQADVYLLDDPLAALDAEVGRKVFADCVRGVMEGTTRVLVTHQMHVLDQCDWIVVMDDGRVVEEGTFGELMGRKDEEGLRKMMKDYLVSFHQLHRLRLLLGRSFHHLRRHHPLRKASRKPSELPTSTTSTNLIAEEDRQRGGLKWSIVKDYWNRAGGAPMIALVGASVSLFALSNAVKDLWLAWWSDGTFGLSVGGYINGFAVLGVVNVVMMMVTAYALISAGYVAGKKLHEEALEGLMRAPMSFYDSQPIGRILNRMSKDIEGIDKMLWMVYMNFFYGLCFLISNIITLAYTTPYVLILVAALMVAYYFILNLYRCSTREIKRIAAIEKSPLNAHISECLDGVASLRAFKAEQRMSSTLHSLLDRSNGPNMAQLTIRIWLNIRVQFISSLLILFVSLFGVLTTAFAASLLGLAISTATSLTGQLSYFVMFTALLEAEMVAVEQAPRELPSDPSTESWPNGGAITVTNLSVKYASNADPVLKNVNLDIAPGEKIGIVGRTGSGKSTFLTALFRIVEPHTGSIAIDGTDITTLGLKTLRQRLQIIPQEPVLFTGTVRTNIDPNLVHTDAEIWDALTMVGLKADVASRDGKLDAVVEENGTNFSVGQRQLLILSRALIAQPRILVMDEASSSVDAAADALIQQSIVTHFSHATVISIAHRLNTVAGFDRVVVLDAGRVVEVGMPAELLRMEDGHFKRLVDATG